MSTKAVPTIIAIFANSEGWNCIPKNVIHLAAPFILSPVKTPIAITKARSIVEVGERKNGITRNHLHGMLCTKITMATPTSKITLCWVIGTKWSAYLYDSVLVGYLVP